MFSIEINSIEELAGAAKKFIREFKENRVFAFYGKMGAGKTTFIKALCRAMGSEDNITSPTFALVNEYDSGMPEKIYHFDFYRIKNMEEALDIGLDDYIYSGNYCFIEWPERIAQLLPEDLVEVQITEVSHTSREIKAKRV